MPVVDVSKVGIIDSILVVGSVGRGVAGRISDDVDGSDAEVTVGAAADDDEAGPVAAGCAELVAAAADDAVVLRPPAALLLLSLSPGSKTGTMPCPPVGLAAAESAVVRLVVGAGAWFSSPPPSRSPTVSKSPDMMVIRSEN